MRKLTVEIILVIMVMAGLVIIGLLLWDEFRAPPPGYELRQDAETKIYHVVYVPLNEIIVANTLTRQGWEFDTRGDAIRTAWEHWTRSQP